jgi:hypothetical protein
MVDAGEMRGFADVHLSGSIGFYVVGAMRYHLKAHSVPVRCVVLERCVSAAA